MTLGADARPHVFVGDLDAPELDGDDRRHLERVLRVRAGDEITITDGGGRWRPTLMGPTLEPFGAVIEEPRRSPDVTVAVSLLKGRKLDLVAQKTTELGVDRIVLIEADRCVTRWSAEKAARARDRLGRVIREAAMQSRRCRLPVLEGPLPAGSVLAWPSATLAHLEGGGGPSLDRPTILIGPEGGWSADELAAGGDRVVLGPHVLRAETAAIAAAARLVGLRSDAG